MEWHELEKLTVVKLREMGHDEGMKGVHGMNKPELLDALADKLGIEKPHEEMAEEAIHTKAELKEQIRELRKERHQALEAHDHKNLKAARRKIHRLKRKIRRMHLEAQKAAYHAPKAAASEGA